MFKIIIGVVFTIAIVVGACILCVKQEKKMSEEAAQKKQIVERERAERAKRIENNPAFQRMMDRCVSLFIKELLYCSKSRNERESFTIYVHASYLHVYVSVSRDTKVTFREFDMEDIPNVEILFAFMKATQNILAEKIIFELKKYGITNCGCDITYKRE